MHGTRDDHDQSYRKIEIPWRCVMTPRSSSWNVSTSWSITSGKDPRWNMSGECAWGDVISDKAIPPVLEKKLKELEKKIGPRPHDLEIVTADD
jgi:hypothetical protein